MTASTNIDGILDITVTPIMQIYRWPTGSLMCRVVANPITLIESVLTTVVAILEWPQKCNNRVIGQKTDDQV